MVLEPSEEDLMDAVRVYLTLRYLCERENANEVTINCGRFTEEKSGSELPPETLHLYQRLITGTAESTAGVDPPSNTGW